MKNIAALALYTLMAACVAPYSLPAGKPTAALTFEVSTDSTGITLMKPSYVVSTFEDSSCTSATDGTRLLMIKSTGPKDVAGPVTVAAGDPMTLAITTVEARLFQNRQCSFTTTFTPSAGQAYTVQFASVDQGHGCGMNVLDAAGKQVTHKEPKNSCANTMAGAIRNGGAGIAEPELRAVTAGERFPGPVLNISAPNSEGWKLASDSSSAGMLFGRIGSLPHETFVAAVARIAVPEIQTKEEFLAQVKHDVTRDSPPDKYRNFESTFEYSDQRGYPCVLFKGSAVEVNVKTSTFGRSDMLFQIQALYCRLPNLAKTGFAAMFSHRGGSVVADFDAQARDFIEGVQVPHE